jgi:EAL domain-containing protein (putative c-di-GMP-specific phosphodiesterase class I)
VILSRIETPSELEAALALGFEYGQGWHFARPARADGLKGAGAFSGPAHGAAARAAASPFAVPV